MRSFILIILITIYALPTFGQEVLIPDSKLLDALILNGVDTNQDSLIQVSEAQAVSTLDLSSSEITDLTGLIVFNNLVEIDFNSNDIQSFDLSGNTKLKFINCSYNPINVIDFSKNVELNRFIIGGGADEYLYVNYGNLDICAFEQTSFAVGGGFPQHDWVFCVRDDESEQCMGFGGTVVTYHTDCTFPSDLGYQNKRMYGQVRFDNNSSCTSESPHIDDFKFKVKDLNSGDSFIINPFYSETGYSLGIPKGRYNIQVKLPNENLFYITPYSFDIDVEVGEFIHQNFCVGPREDLKTDVSLNIIPLNAARPGFTAEYKLVYTNHGNTIPSGEIVFDYPEEYVTYIPSNASVSDEQGKLVLTFEDLAVFESESTTISFTLNTPMDDNPLQDGDILEYRGTITPDNLDCNRLDNVTNLHQDVVNSYDPNDKTCIQGQYIRDTLLDGYLDYMIRFENTGSAEAVNIFIEDKIDRTKFDISSFNLIDASHPVEVLAREDKLTFFFNDIYLPFDDDNNDGYVIFEIKAKQTVEVGDTLSNSAEIFFDFNFPIITNMEESIIFTEKEEIDTNSNSEEYRIYPNPANDVLIIESPLGSNPEYRILDINGKTIMHFLYEEMIDISQIHEGVYFVCGTDSSSEKPRIKKLVIAR